MRTLSSESPNHVRQATVDLSRADPQYLWNPSSTMGKCQSPPLSAEMNVGNNNPELGGFMPEKKLSDGDDIATVSLFSNYEDVEKLKCEMREVVVEVNTRSPPNTGNKLDSKSTTNDHLLQPRLEMSSSLPNLSVITEKGSEILSKLSQRIISTSAADVRKSVASSRVTNSPDNLCSSRNDGTLDCASDRSMNLVQDKELESLSPQTGSGETGSESGSDNTMTVTTSCNSINSNGDFPSLNVSKHNTDKVQSKERNANTLTLSIDSNNSKLSTVLENIPLMYIPKTKQLVPCNNCDTMVNALSMQTSSPCETASLPGECSTMISPSFDDVDAHSDVSSHTQMNTSFSSASNILDISVSSCTALLDDATCDAEKDEERDFLSKLELNGKTESPCSTLPRSTTAGSLGQTDTSSYSSISSLSLGNGETSANASISDESNLELRSNGHSEFDDTAFMEVNLDGRNSFEKCRNPSQDSGIVDANDTNGAKPKRRSGFSSFFSRSLFSKKPKDQESAPGWKLFGKVTPKEVPTKNPNQITEEYQANQRALARKKDIEVTSTTALILENRPSGLPCKTPEEELKHRQQYEAMVEAAKKKEQKEAKQKKKQMQQLLKLEEKMTHALKIWNEEILPSWESMSVSKKAKDLWWIGLPPSVRGKVWTLAIGNELNITPELYEICVSRAEDRIRIMSEGDTDSICSNEPASSKEASVDLIKLDVSRTFPQLCIFQRGGPYHDLLHSLLGAYACYRPDVGYVQGMSFIAAVLLLNMEVADAFICFANLLNKPCQVTFFRMDESIMKAYFVTYEEFFEENLPRLYNHFVKQKLTPDLYIIDWMFTLFSKSLPLDVASRVWDVFCRDSEEFLFRTALGILKLHEPVLLNLDFIHLAQFLTRLPENISSEKLFMNIRQIEMTIDSRKYSQVLATNRDNLKDG